MKWICTLHQNHQGSIKLWHFLLNFWNAFQSCVERFRLCSFCPTAKTFELRPCTRSQIMGWFIILLLLLTLFTMIKSSNILQLLRTPFFNLNAIMTDVVNSNITLRTIGPDVSILHTKKTIGCFIVKLFYRIKTLCCGSGR